MEDLKARFVAELDRRRVLTLATLRPDGWPQATIVGYVNDGTAIYFMIGRASQKFANIAADPRVSICVGEDVADPMAISGASMAATVREVTDKAEQDRALALMLRRYPEYEPMMKGVDLGQMAFMRADPFVASLLTYEKGFGHTDTVQLAATPAALPPSPLDHVGLKVSDYAAAKAFYGKALAPLGFALVMEMTKAETGGAFEGAGFGCRGKPSFWISTGEAPTGPIHLAFTATRAEVDAFHAAAIAAGAKDNGPPGLRPHYHPNYYGAFVIGPDGANIEAVCHRAG